MTDLNWTMQLATVWKNIPSPARSSESELKVFEKYVKEIAKRKDPKILVMGSTPEFRDLALKYGCKPTVVDISKDVYKALTLLRKEEGDEEFINYDWLKMHEDQKYDLILGDGVPNMLAWEEWDAVLRKINSILKPDGISVQRIYSFYTAVTDEALLEKINEYKELKPQTTFFKWVMWCIILNDVHNNGRFSFNRCTERLKDFVKKGIIRQEEFEEWKYFDSPIQISVPRRIEADRIINKNLRIKDIIFGTEPNLSNMAVYICEKR